LKPVVLHTNNHTPEYSANNSGFVIGERSFKIQLFNGLRFSLSVFILSLITVIGFANSFSSELKSASQVHHFSSASAEIHTVPFSNPLDSDFLGDPLTLVELEEENESAEDHHDDVYLSLTNQNHQGNFFFISQINTSEIQSPDLFISDLFIRYRSLLI